MATRFGTLSLAGALLPATRVHRVPFVCLHGIKFIKLVKIRDCLACMPFPQFRSQEAYWGGFFCGPTVPNKCQNFTLVRASGGHDGAVHPQCVNHGDMWLTPKHGQVHAELLDIHDKIAERHPTGYVARASPELRGELSLDGSQVVHCAPQFLEDRVNAGVYHIPGGVLSPPQGLRPLLVGVGVGVGVGSVPPPMLGQPGGGECCLPLVVE